LTSLFSLLTFFVQRNESVHPSYASLSIIGPYFIHAQSLFKPYCPHWQFPLDHLYCSVFCICGIYPDLVPSSVHTESTCGSCGQSWCMVSGMSYLIGQKFWLWCLPSDPGCPQARFVDWHHRSQHSHCSPQICILLPIIYLRGHCISCSPVAHLPQSHPHPVLIDYCPHILASVHSLPLDLNPHYPQPRRPMWPTGPCIAVGYWCPGCHCICSQVAGSRVPCRTG